MDPIRRFRRPALRSPRAVVAWEGWNDAGDAASSAAEYLLGEDAPDPFAILEPEEFFDFQQRRPIVAIDERGARSLQWPDTRFYAVERPEDGHDLVVAIGEEPGLRWKTYARSVAAALADAGVEVAVTLGAYLGEVAHTMSVPITGSASDTSLVRGIDLGGSEYEGPTGIVAVTMEALREVGIPAVSLWAATPHYLSANPNPRAALALARGAARVLELDIDTAELEASAREFSERVDAAMAGNTEFVDYVKRLEEAVPSSEHIVRDGPSLISEIEEFLRDR